MSYSIPGYSEELVTSSRSTKLQVFRGLHGYLMGKRVQSSPSRRERRDAQETQLRRSVASRRQAVELYRLYDLNRFGIPMPRSTARGGFALRSKRLRKKAGLG